MNLETLKDDLIREFFNERLKIKHAKSYFFLFLKKKL